jgi:small subunit ribosomal protein S3
LGHKVHPTGFRLGVVKGWDSRWYADRNYKDLLAEDLRLRALIDRRLANAGVARIEIERVAGTQLGVTIHTAKPGIVIGKSGESVERLRQTLERETKKKVRLTILEIRNPEVEAVLVARSIAEQLEKRISFRRAMKQAVQKAMRANAKGIKVVVGGRLGGAEIARTEKEVEGSVPLQTLRANIDFGLAEAHTTYGVVGVKVWIYHGDVLPERQRQLGPSAIEPTAVPSTGDRGPRPGGDRGPRGPRPTGGDRGDRGDRGPRPMGDRGARPTSDRGPRPMGDRPARPAGERPARPVGDRPLGDRPARTPSAEPPSAERPTEATVTPAEAAPTAPELATAVPTPTEPTAEIQTETQAEPKAEATAEPKTEHRTRRRTTPAAHDKTSGETSTDDTATEKPPVTGAEDEPES